MRLEFGHYCHMAISVVLAGTILFFARRLPLDLIEDQCSVQLLGHVWANFHSTVGVYQSTISV